MSSILEGFGGSCCSKNYAKSAIKRWWKGFNHLLEFVIELNDLLRSFVVHFVDTGFGARNNGDLRGIPNDIKSNLSLMNEYITAIQFL